MAKRHFVPPAQTSIQRDLGGARAEHDPTK
jgi:hypothetical protein